MRLILKVNIVNIIGKLIEIEYNCERLISYIKVPEQYPFLKHPKKEHDLIAVKVLNNTWVSVPHGSEHQSSFTVMRKNGFEEALFKV